MTPETVRERLAELDAACEDARARLAAQHNPARRGLDNAARIVDELTQYHAAVAYRQRRPDEKTLRRLSREAADAIIAEGLVFEPVNPHNPGPAFRLYDPVPVREYDEAQRAATDAAAERDRFAAEHAELLADAERRDKMDALRDALGSDDPDALAAALHKLPAPPPTSTPLTTHDLPAL